MEESPNSQNLHYWGTTPEEEYYSHQGVHGTKSYYTSPRGLTLFTRTWLPISTPPRGLICMVHGYGNDISWTFQSTAIFLAAHGFAAAAIDLEGHGRSSGLRAFVPNVDLVVDDCISFFDSVKNESNFHSLPSFLYGESMGGAICLLIHFRNHSAFSGAILMAPMCKISDSVRPKFPIPQILMIIAKILPTLAIVPTADLIEKSIKVEEKRAVAMKNPMRYNGKPRLGTVSELIRITDYVSERLGDVTLPFVVSHGDADAVTDPNVSRALYEDAKSGDKTLKIYDGMMHSLMFGETDENVEIVRSDILDWLDQRCN